MCGEMGKKTIYAFILFIYFCTAYRITRMFFFVPRSQHHNQHRSAAVCCGTGERTRLAVRLLPSLLGLSCHPRPHLSQISLTILLFGVMWFPRLYLHYCSQWLFLLAQHIPINRWDIRDPPHRTIIRKHTVSGSSSFQTHKYMQKCSRRQYADLYKCLLTIIHWKHTLIRTNMHAGDSCAVVVCHICAFISMQTNAHTCTVFYKTCLNFNYLMRGKSVDFNMRGYGPLRMHYLERIYLLLLCGQRFIINPVWYRSMVLFCMWC